MKRFQPQVVLAAMALLGSAGCADRPIVGSDDAESPLEAKLGQPPQQQQVWTSDDEFARVARAEVPGFAGYYFDMTGTPDVLKGVPQDASRTEAVEAPKSNSSAALPRLARVTSLVTEAPGAEVADQVAGDKLLARTVKTVP